MSHIGPAYGSLAANQAKIAAKRDPNLDQEAQEWIEAIIGEKFPDVPYEDALKDGVILCKLINKLQPGAVPKYATSGGAFKLRENISVFQNAARAYGLGDSELFQTIDLFEKRNIAQVTQCVFALGRTAQKKRFNGPTLGPKMSEANARDFTEEQLRAGQSSLGLLNEGMSKVSSSLTCGQNGRYQLEGFSRAQSGSENVSLINKHHDRVNIQPSQTKQPQTKEKYMSRPARAQTASASSDLSDSSVLFDYHQRSRSQQRTLSNISVANLLTSLQTIQLPLSHISEQQQQQHEEEDDDSSLQLLIDLARETDLTRMDKLDRLHTFIEDSIGMVELLSILRFIKSSSSSEMNIDEPPLNLYSSILPTITALFMLENDV